MLEIKVDLKQLNKSNKERSKIAWSYLQKDFLQAFGNLRTTVSYNLKHVSEGLKLITSR